MGLLPRARKRDGGLDAVVANVRNIFYDFNWTPKIIIRNWCWGSLRLNAEWTTVFSCDYGMGAARCWCEEQPCQEN